MPRQRYVVKVRCGTVCPLPECWGGDEMRCRAGDLAWPARSDIKAGKKDNSAEGGSFRSHVRDGGGQDASAPFRHKVFLHINAVMFSHARLLRPLSVPWSSSSDARATSKLSARQSCQRNAAAHVRTQLCTLLGDTPGAHLSSPCNYTCTYSKWYPANHSTVTPERTCRHSALQQSTHPATALRQTYLLACLLDLLQQRVVPDRACDKDLLLL